jgi:hypothetical protein
VELAAKYSGFANAKAIDSAIELSKEENLPFSVAVERIVRDTIRAIEARKAEQKKNEESHKNFPAHNPTGINRPANS